MNVNINPALCYRESRFNIKIETDEPQTDFSDLKKCAEIIEKICSNDDKFYGLFKFWQYKNKNKPTATDLYSRYVDPNSEPVIEIGVTMEGAKKFLHLKITLKHTGRVKFEKEVLQMVLSRATKKNIIVSIINNGKSHKK